MSGTQQYGQSPLSSNLLTNEETVRVLLIEDDKSYADLINILLSNNNDQECEVTIAHTLADGFEQLNSNKTDFDAVLLDLNLPDSEGLNTLHRLMNAFPNRSIIVLTGTNNREQGVKAVGAGAQDYLVKGEFDLTYLARVLRFSMERKQILSRLEEAQQIAKVGNWEMRPEQDYFYASKEVYRILGVEINQISYSYTDLADPNCPFHFLRVQEASIEEDKQFILTLEIRNKERQLQYVEFNSRCFSSNEASKIYIGTVQDITLQKKTEELQFNQELAEETARVREQVIANVSHELRTPMNAIVGMSNLLVKTPMTTEQEECLSAIQEASQLLLGIINDILLTSSLQNGPVELNPSSFDLALTVRRVIELLSPKAVAKDLELKYKFSQAIEHRLIGDKQRLSQVFYNIIGNAIKFTERGNVKLVINNKGLKDGKIYYDFAIHDTGPGIPAEKQEEIFQAFNRINTPGKVIEGTGLGLSIAKQLVTQMGGTLSLQSTLGKGSVFSFTLPFTAESESTITDSSPKKTKQTKHKAIIPKKILVVEDHKMNQIVINKTLLNEYPDINIVIANNGEEALNYLKDQVFELILMDIQLPGIDGFETTRIIRQDLSGQHVNTPILAMTAQAQITEDERYREAGLNDYILKPFNPEELFYKMTQHLMK